MNIPTSLDLEQIAAACVRREPKDLFIPRDSQLDEFANLIADSKILITGASGFIARATLNHVLKANPKLVYLVDSSENGLANLARLLATTQAPERLRTIHMVLADITSPIFTQAVEDIGALDVVLHFAAVKHVRSERDAASALRLLDVNVLGTHRLLEALSTLVAPPRVFAVSTDKAVRPTSLMGASKALMESLLWSYSGKASSARFANVLFSSGSITESWIQRLEVRDPLSAPHDTHRFFVTPREAGRICANAVVAPAGTVVVPVENAVQTIELTELAARFLAFFNLTPLSFSLDEWHQKGRQVTDTGADSFSYPLIVTPRDTTGEKRKEEFVSPNEVSQSWSTDLLLVPGQATNIDPSIISRLRKLVDDTPSLSSLESIVDLVRASVPSYNANRTSVTLDHRI